MLWNLSAFCFCQFFLWECISKLFLLYRNNRSQCFIKNCFEKLRKIHTKHLHQSLSLTKLHTQGLQLYLKESSVQLFSCEFCKIFQKRVSRSSWSQMFFKSGVFKSFALFTGKHLCWSLFLIKLQAWRHATLVKKILQHRCFPVNIMKYLRTFFYRAPPVAASQFPQNTCERLLL